VSQSLGYIPKSGITGSNGRSMSSFLSKGSVSDSGQGSRSFFFCFGVKLGLRLWLELGLVRNYRIDKQASFIYSSIHHRSASYVQEAAESPHCDVDYILLGVIDIGGMLGSQWLVTTCAHFFSIPQDIALAA
jgi:hypothetical protein